MTLTPEKLDELERALSGRCWLRLFRYVGKCRQIPTFRNATASRPRLQLPLRESLVRVARERDAQAARIAELEQRLEKVRAVETYYSDERFDSCDCPCCDGRIEVREKLTTILEGDSA